MIRRLSTDQVSASETPSAEYVLRLQPLPDPGDPDGIRRLRALLKRAGRDYGLRCTEVAPGQPGTGGQQGTGWLALSAVVAGILRDGADQAGARDQGKEVSGSSNGVPSGTIASRVLLTERNQEMSRNG